VLEIRDGCGVQEAKPITRYDPAALAAAATEPPGREFLIADIRRNVLDEVSSRLPSPNVLVVEDLPVANLVRGKRLARAIADAAWAEGAVIEAAQVPDRQPGGRVTPAPGGEGAGHRFGGGEPRPCEPGTEAPAIR
jgi:hypothetical protein